MRLNVDNYLFLLEEKQLSGEQVRKAAGLSESTYAWILERGSIECETLERIADAAGCSTQDILSPDYEGYAENVIEFVRDGKTATLSLSQRRYITRVKQLAEKYPDECKILAENEDGSLYAHIPVDWIRINPNMELSEEQREALRKRMKKLNSGRVAVVQV